MNTTTATTVGTTIHDEVVTVTGSKVRIAGHITYRLDSKDAAAAKALTLVPAHRRTA